MMESITCFLCTGNTVKESLEFYDVQSSVVPSSKKPLHIVLQHLANCIKYKLIFQNDTYICAECFTALSNYDDLMLNLLTAQKRLTCQLQNALMEKSEPMEMDKLVNDEPIEIELEFEDDPNLEDAFNPNLDTKEELIEVDDGVIEEEVIDDSTAFSNDSNRVSAEYIDIDSSDIKRMDYGDYKRVRLDCVICGVVFTSKFLLQSHINESHNGKQFTCKICGVSRKDEEYLELHMNIHEGKTENECRYCPKRFSRPVNTLRHMRVHWDKKKFQCEKCGERFSLDNMLYNHRLRHEAEENPVICSICNQSFKSRKTYNHHVLIHQENRPRHYCTVCPKSFTERYTLKMHLKSHSDRQSPTSTVDIKSDEYSADQKDMEEETVGELVEGDDVDSNCVICNKKFNDKESFELHLHQYHDVVLK